MKEICTIDSVILRHEIQRLKRALELAESELEARGGEDRVVYGFSSKYGYTVRKTFEEAVTAAVDYFKDPDAGEYVQKIYLHKGENI